MHYYVIYWDDDFTHRVVSPVLRNHATALSYAKATKAYYPKIVVEVASQLEENG